MVTAGEAPHSLRYLPIKRRFSLFSASLPLRTPHSWRILSVSPGGGGGDTSLEARRDLAPCIEDGHDVGCAGSSSRS